MPRTFEETGLVRAEAKWVRSSARKARIVLEHIRGKRVGDARAILTYSPRAVSRDIELVLRSAVSNAEANHGLDADELVIAAAYANEGVTMKRWQARARGRAMRIRKRTTHITILLRADENAAARTGRRRGAATAGSAPAAASDAAAEAAASPAAEEATAATAWGGPEPETVDASEGGETTDAAAGDDPTPVAQSSDAPAEGARDDQSDNEPESASTEQAAEGSRELVEDELGETDPDTTTDRG